MMARRVLTVIAALLVGTVIVRNAAVGLLAQRAPADAARVWPITLTSKYPLR